MNKYNLTLTPATWKQITGPWGACSNHVAPVKAKLGGKSVTALQVIEMPGQTDAAAVYRCLWLLKRTDRRTAVYLAEKCARRVLPEFESKYPDDKRPREALNCIKRWLAGRATDAELWAAADAACAAADASYAAYATAEATYAAYTTAEATYAAVRAAYAAYAAYATYAAKHGWQREIITRELRKLVKL